MQAIKAQKILTTNNTKILKGASAGYLTAGIHFAPEKLSGHQMCPKASLGCKLACLNTAGQGVYNTVQAARIKKTKRFFIERETFMAQLIKEISAIVRKAQKKGAIPAIRLNLTSDWQWENTLHEGKTIFQWFPNVQFYDYTAIDKRMMPGSKAQSIPNYHLTFSRKEDNQNECEAVANVGGNIAVVFAGKLPEKYMGRRVVSGDDNDLRFLDEKGVIVGLTTKGRAKRDKSGFVVSL